jgi:hypothetical protein
MLSTSLTNHVFHKVLKAEVPTNDSFEGMDLEELVVLENLHLTQTGVNADCHVLTFPLYADTIVFEIQADGPVGIDFALKVLALPPGAPGVGINLSRNRGQGEQGRKRLPGWAIAAGESLIGALVIGMDLETRRGIAGLLKGGWAIDGQAFLLIGAVKALHKSILLRVMGITDLDLDVQARTEAQKGRGEITALGTPYPARISIHGHLLR